MWRKQGWLGRAVRGGRIVFDPAWNLDGSVNQAYAARMRAAADKLDAAVASLAAPAATPAADDASSDVDAGELTGWGAPDVQSSPAEPAAAENWLGDDATDGVKSETSEDEVAGADVSDDEAGADESDAGAPPPRTLQEWIDEIIDQTEPSAQGDASTDSIQLKPGVSYDDAASRIENVELDPSEMALADKILVETNAPPAKRGLVILLLYPNKYFQKTTPEHAKSIMKHFFKNRFRATQLLRMIYYTSAPMPDDRKQNFQGALMRELVARVFQTWNSTEPQWKQRDELSKNVNLGTIVGKISAAASQEFGPDEDAQPAPVVFK